MVSDIRAPGARRSDAGDHGVRLRRAQGKPSARDTGEVCKFTKRGDGVSENTHTSTVPVKDKIPYYVGLFEGDFLQGISHKTIVDFIIQTIGHSTANEFVYHHHYLHRKLYIARNVSYGLFIENYLVGVCMFGYPVWREYPGIVPPLLPAECPELLRVCTISDLPKNTESYFVSRCIKAMSTDWKIETGISPRLITSLCDNSLGFSGALYKALNFIFYNETEGRSANIGKTHGKWNKNTDGSKSKKTMYIYPMNKKERIRYG